jgi:steroid delta-isomerase-like uncharacterized protein
MKKIFLLFALAGIISSCMNNNSSNNKAAANKAGMQRFYDEVINAHNPAMIDSFCTADFIDNNPEKGHSGKGLDDAKASFKEWFTSMPDVHVSADFMVAEGDTVVAMVTMTGTNSGPMGNMPATNKKINIKGIDIVALKDGKATQRWGYFDNMAMMMQMGMMPGGGAPPPPADSPKAMEEKK